MLKAQLSVANILSGPLGDPEAGRHNAWVPQEARELNAVLDRERGRYRLRTGAGVGSTHRTSSTVFDERASSVHPDAAGAWV